MNKSLSWRHFLLFVAMNGHISPGLASLVIQVQVFFTIGLALVMAGLALNLLWPMLRQRLLRRPAR